MESIRDDIRNESVSDDALTRDCCWRALCRVRGWFYDEIPEPTWRHLCQRRGMLLAETVQ